MHHLHNRPRHSDSMREEKLKESEELYRTVVEQATENIFIVDPESKRILQGNPALQRSLGYAPDELEDITLYDIVAHDRESIDRNTEQILEGHDFSSERRYRRKDGTLIDVEVSARPFPYRGGQAICVVAHDITQRKMADDQILFQTHLLQHVETAIIATDLQGSVTHWNDYAEKLYGWTRAEVLGTNIAELTIGPSEAAVTQDIRKQLRAGGSWAGEITLWRKDGSTFISYVALSLVHDAQGQAIGVVGISTDITERKQVENNLRQNLSVLLALREAGQVLGSTLKSEEIITSLLEIMRSVSDLTAAVISMHDATGRLYVWRSVGLQTLWPRARFAPEAETSRLAAIESEEQRLFRLRHPDPGRESLVGLCLPLKVKDHVIGVLEAYGPETLAHSDTAEILNSLASQAASALENARLYEEVEERERKLQGLVEKLLGAQEEERRRVAYEVHDGLAQVAVASHQHLQAFASRYAPNEERGRRDLERILRLVRGTVSDARKIIANLRPTTLDDLGLAATISLEVERLRGEGYQVDYEVSLGNDRLPNVVEITIFRVIQEALTNMRKYAQSQLVRIQLQRQKDSIYLKVQDYGRGFDPTAVSAGSGPGEKVGLAGMRERVSIVGGKLEIDSSLGVGTSVMAAIPLIKAL